MPDQDLGAEFYELTQDVTAAAGLPAYEVSNHARPGANAGITSFTGATAIMSRRARCPWAHHVGASKLATATERHPETWLENVESHGQALTENAGLSEEEQGDEFLLMGLRLTEGIDLKRYERYASRSIDPLRLAALIEHGMVEEIGENRIRATREGFFVLDAVVADLAA